MDHKSISNRTHTRRTRPSLVHGCAISRDASYIIVHSLPIEPNVESLRWFERVPVEEVAAAAMRKSICEPSVGGRATHHDHDGSVPVYLDVSDK